MVPCFHHQPIARCGSPRPRILRRSAPRCTAQQQGTPSFTKLGEHQTLFFFFFEVWLIVTMGFFSGLISHWWCDSIAGIDLSSGWELVAVSNSQNFMLLGQWKSAINCGLLNVVDIFLFGVIMQMMIDDRLRTGLIQRHWFSFRDFGCLFAVAAKNWVDTKGLLLTGGVATYQVVGWLFPYRVFL